MVKILFLGWICREIVWMEFDVNLGIHALLPSWQSQLVIFTKSLFIIAQYSQLCHLVPNFHDFLSSAHMTLTVQSVRSAGFGVLIEQSLCGANFVSIRPQENVSLIVLHIGYAVSSCGRLNFWPGGMKVITTTALCILIPQQLTYYTHHICY